MTKIENMREANRLGRLLSECFAGASGSAGSCA